jgi:hypothetical protein
MIQHKAETVQEKSSNFAHSPERALQLRHLEAFIITILFALGAPYLMNALAQEDILDRFKVLFSDSFNDDDRWEDELDRNDDADIRGGELHLDGIGFDRINFIRIPDTFSSPALRFTFTLEAIPQVEEGYAVAEIRVRTLSLPGNDSNDGILTYDAVRLYVNQNTAFVNLIRNGEETQAHLMDTSGWELIGEYSLVYLPPESFDDDTELGQLQVMNGSVLLFTYPIKLKPGLRSASLGVMAAEGMSFESLEVARP